MPSGRLWILAPAALCLAACARTRPTSEAAPAGALTGSYELIGLSAGRFIHGTLAFDEHQAYDIRTNLGNCRGRLSEPATRRTLQLNCYALFEFRLARGKLLDPADVSVTSTERVAVGAVCRQYEVDPQTRQQICVKLETQYENRKVARRERVPVLRAAGEQRRPDTVSRALQNGLFERRATAPIDSVIR